MSLASYNPYSRYRQRLFYRLLAFVMVVAVMAVSFFTGLMFGRERVSQDGVALQEQIKVISAERDTLQETVTALRTEARTATMRFEQMQENYHETVKQGPAAEIMTLVNKQLEEGMDPERIEYLIRSARPPRNCTDPQTQRFVVSTPAYTGAESRASIAEGAIAIKGKGASARNDKGASEAWYDPSKPVTMEFTINDGRTMSKKGTMPISHSIVVGSREYRLTIAEGARSFAKVTFDSCDYP
ncbi:MAG: hypothetical protein IT558_00240 [Alphaproteobacteria bacterium]|nr:hypothetical protein [Alphaproteobacteria bacterium]